MSNLLSHFRRVSLAGLITLSLIPFACQALLTIVLHGSCVSQTSISSDSSGHRNGARTLLRQINSQAQEDSFKDFKKVLNIMAVANAIAILILCSASFYRFVVLPSLNTPSSNRLLPLRI